jgi:hypothetical protein
VWAVSEIRAYEVIRTSERTSTGPSYQQQMGILKPMEENFSPSHFGNVKRVRSLATKSKASDVEREKREKWVVVEERIHGTPVFNGNFSSVMSGFLPVTSHQPPPALSLRLPDVQSSR